VRDNRTFRDPGGGAVQFFGCRFRQDVFAAATVMAMSVEGLTDQEHAAGHVHVSCNADQGADGYDQGHAGYLLFEGQAPLDGARFGFGEQAGRFPDFFRFQSASFRYFFHRIFLNPFFQVVEAVGPFFHEVVVVQIFCNDDVQESDGQGRVCARPDRQPHFGSRSPPGQPGIDGDDLRSQLHTFDDPMAEEAVAVALQGIVPPDDHAARRFPFFVLVTVFVLDRGVHDHEVAGHSRAAYDAGQVTGES